MYPRRPRVAHIDATRSARARRPALSARLIYIHVSARHVYAVRDARGGKAAAFLSLVQHMMHVLIPLKSRATSENGETQALYSGIVCSSSDIDIDFFPES